MKSRSHQGRSIRPEPPPPRTAARCENPAARPAAKATAGFDLPPLLLLLRLLWLLRLLLLRPLLLLLLLLWLSRAKYRQIFARKFAQTGHSIRFRANRTLYWVSRGHFGSYPSGHYGHETLSGPPMLNSDIISGASTFVNQKVYWFTNFYTIGALLL